LEQQVFAHSQRTHVDQVIKKILLPQKSTSSQTNSLGHKSRLTWLLCRLGSLCQVWLGAIFTFLWQENESEK
jgi:hypothetical protein